LGTFRRPCETCGELTDRPPGAVGQGRRQLYGRVCDCDRRRGRLGEDVNIKGVGPMAEVVGVDRKQFARMRDSDLKRFHTYLRDNTSFVASLQAWGELYRESRAEGIGRRMLNLRQYAHLETLTMTQQQLHLYLSP